MTKLQSVSLCVSPFIHNFAPRPKHLVYGQARGRIRFGSLLLQEPFGLPLKLPERKMSSFDACPPGFSNYYFEISESMNVRKFKGYVNGSRNAALAVSLAKPALDNLLDNYLDNQPCRTPRKGLQKNLRCATRPHLGSSRRTFHKRCHWVIQAVPYFDEYTCRNARSGCAEGAQLTVDRSHAKRTDACILSAFRREANTS